MVREPVALIRVAFPLFFRDRSWMGGVNYFRNLFEALRLSSLPAVETIAVTGNAVDRNIIDSLGAEDVLATPWADPAGWRWKLRRSLVLGCGRDFVFERFLEARGISLYSHLGYLGKHARIPSLTWIPDFQERYHPEFFSAEEIAIRDLQNRRTVRHATAILLSSEHAREGLAEISPAAARAAHVLPFVVSVPPLDELPGREVLEARYGVSGEYFFLPNQFWAHKNHEVVLRALRLLKEKGKPVTVLASGNPHDYRQPEHGKNLLRKVNQWGIEENFRLLGSLPYLDLMGLMSGSIGVLNPSLFEGWSTTVEEAKSLGKLVIASNIPVHREQAPARAIFFNPHAPEVLADTLLEVAEQFCQSHDMACMRQAELELPARRLDFARRYEAIVRQLVR